MKKKINCFIVAAFLTLINQGYGSQTEFNEMKSHQEIRKSISLTALKDSEFEQPFNKIFNNLLEEIKESTKCSNSESSLICWIAQEEIRKYNPSNWNLFKKKDMFTNMTSVDIQNQIISVLLYRGFYNETSIEITDFKAVADSEKRARAELIRALTPISFFESASAYNANSYMPTFYNLQKQWNSEK